MPSGPQPGPTPALSDPRPAPPKTGRSLIWAIACACILIELALQAADHGVIGAPTWRSLAYHYGAFWPFLIGNWQPNFELQPITMFLTYAFLHGGLGHLVGNMITLASLGTIVTDAFGQRGFLIIYTVSAIGGAVTYALVLPAPFPMVGASGALFGLAGAWQYDLYASATASRRRLWLALRAGLGVIGLNLILLIYMDGRMAWQTHLGGFVTGWAAAALCRHLARPGPRAAHDSGSRLP